MKAITFENTKTPSVGWSMELYKTLNRGYAYSLPTHNVFLCGETHPLANWCYLETNVTSTLEDWCQNKFGAINIQQTEYDVGSAIHSVWRPGLFSAKELKSALAFDDRELFQFSQALRILIERLDEILLFIEPDINHSQVFGHKTRDLLISACTEVENYFQHYMKMSNAAPIGGNFFTIRDYARLSPKLFLEEYEIEMHAYAAVGSFSPFKNWNPSNTLLQWYDAYNKTKHHRNDEFSKASLINCIHAIGACLVLFSVRFGPIWWASNFVNSPIPDAYRLFRQPAYKGDPRKVYVPMIPLSPDITSWQSGNFSDRTSWQTAPFSL